jgi:hypothetical protein
MENCGAWTVKFSEKTRPGRNLGVEFVWGLDREVKHLVTTNGTEKRKTNKEGSPLSRDAV